MRVKRMLTYMLKYGFMAMFGRIVRGGKYRPTRLSLFYRLLYGERLLASIVGTLKFENVEIVLTLPFRWGGGAAYWLSEKIANMPDTVLTVAIGAKLNSRMLEVELHICGKKEFQCEIDSLFSLTRIRAFEHAQLTVSTIFAWHEYVGGEAMNDTCIKAIISEISNLRQSLCCRLVYLVHDYYSFCPRMFVCRPDGAYCASEADESECVSCVASGCNMIGTSPMTNVVKWRSVMKEFLSEVDEVRTFCSDSKERMEKVFPNLSCTVVPHSEPTGINRMPRIQRVMLQIGIIGQISLIKGAYEVIRFANWLSEHEPCVKIHIVGTLCCSESEKPANITETGVYRQRDLPDLIESEGINVVWFPSTFPETFSYVMHEIIQMGLPVICYDRGAQQECVKKYSLGRSVPLLPPERLMQEFKSLFNASFVEDSSNG